MSGVTVQTRIAFTSVRVDPALGQRAAGGLKRQIGGRHTGVRNVPLANADAVHNPLVVGLDQLFQILIRQNVGWRVATERSDFRLGQFVVPCVKNQGNPSACRKCNRLVVRYPEVCMSEGIQSSLFFESPEEIYAAFFANSNRGLRFRN